MKQIYQHLLTRDYWRILFLILLSTLVQLNLHAQNVGIGTTSPDANAQLDITSTSKGMLIPRLTTTQRTAILNPTKGLIVYDSTSQLIFYYDGGAWQGISNGSSAWSLNGNGGSNPATQFIGTIDNKVLQFRVNNIRAGLIDQLNQTVLFGNKVGIQLPAGSTQNTIIGDSAYSNAKVGSNGNVIIGSGAQAKDTTGGS